MQKGPKGGVEVHKRKRGIEGIGRVRVVANGILENAVEVFLAFVPRVLGLKVDWQRATRFFFGHCPALIAWGSFIFLA